MPRGTAVNSTLILPPPPPQYSEQDQREVRRLLQRFAAQQADWFGVINTPANIGAISGLTGAADTVPYFTGVSTMALATLTPYARTILAAANASDARTLLGLGALAVLDNVTESEIVLADVTTDDVSTTKHGFAPKLPNDATKYLDGTGAYTVPAGSGGDVVVTLPTLTTGGATYQGRFSAEPTVSTITMDTDGRVTAISDATGNWGSSLGVGSFNSPRWLARALNGVRPGIVFNGSTGKLLAGATKSLPQPFTVVGVFQNWKGGAGNNNLFTDAGSGLSVFQSGGTSWAAFAGSSLTSSTLMTLNTEEVPDGMLAAPAVFVSVFNGASSILRNNDNTEVTGAVGASNFTGVLYVGGDTTVSFAHMVLYELVFIAGAINATDRAALVAAYASVLRMGQ